MEGCPEPPIPNTQATATSPAKAPQSPGRSPQQVPGLCVTFPPSAPAFPSPTRPACPQPGTGSQDTPVQAGEGAARATQQGGQDCRHRHPVPRWALGTETGGSSILPGSLEAFSSGWAQQSCPQEPWPSLEPHRPQAQQPGPGAGLTGEDGSGGRQAAGQASGTVVWSQRQPPTHCRGQPGPCCPPQVTAPPACPPGETAAGSPRWTRHIWNQPGGRFKQGTPRAQAWCLAPS